MVHLLEVMSLTALYTAYFVMFAESAALQSLSLVTNDDVNMTTVGAVHPAPCADGALLYVWNVNVVSSVSFEIRASFAYVDSTAEAPGEPRVGDAPESILVAEGGYLQQPSAVCFDDGSFLVGWLAKLSEESSWMLWQRQFDAKRNGKTAMPIRTTRAETMHFAELVLVNAELHMYAICWLGSNAGETGTISLRILSRSTAESSIKDEELTLSGHGAYTDTAPSVAVGRVLEQTVHVIVAWEVDSADYDDYLGEIRARIVAIDLRNVSDGIINTTFSKFVPIQWCCATATVLPPAPAITEYLDAASIADLNFDGTRDCLDALTLQSAFLNSSDSGAAQCTRCNQCMRAVCPADVDSDGSVNVLDLLRVNNNPGVVECGDPLDVTGDDCVVNAKDTAAVQLAWGACPRCRFAPRVSFDGVAFHLAWFHFVGKNSWDVYHQVVTVNAQRLGLPRVILSDLDWRGTFSLVGLPEHVARFYGALDGFLWQVDAKLANIEAVSYIGSADAKHVGETRATVHQSATGLRYVVLWQTPQNSWNVSTYFLARPAAKVMTETLSIPAESTTPSVVASGTACKAADECECGQWTALTTVVLCIASLLCAILVALLLCVVRSNHFKGAAHGSRVSVRLQQVARSGSPQASPRRAPKQHSRSGSRRHSRLASPTAAVGGVTEMPPVVSFGDAPIYQTLFVDGRRTYVELPTKEAAIAAYGNCALYCKRPIDNTYRTIILSDSPSAPWRVPPPLPPDSLIDAVPLYQQVFNAGVMSPTYAALAPGDARLAYGETTLYQKLPNDRYAPIELSRASAEHRSYSRRQLSRGRSQRVSAAFSHFDFGRERPQDFRRKQLASE